MSNFSYWYKDTDYLLRNVLCCYIYSHNINLATLKSIISHLKQRVLYSGKIHFNPKLHMLTC